MAIGIPARALPWHGSSSVGNPFDLVSLNAGIAPERNTDSISRINIRKIEVIQRLHS